MAHNLGRHAGPEPQTLTSPDGSQTRTLQIGNDGRAKLAGGGVQDQLLGSRVGAAPATLGPSDRIKDVSYRPSPDRPSRVAVAVAYFVPLGGAMTASLRAGALDAAPADMVEMAAEEVALEGAVAKVAGVTPALTVNETKKVTMTAELGAGQAWRLVTSASGGATVAIAWARERIY